MCQAYNQWAERKIRGAIFECIAGIKSPGGARIRVDAAPAMQSLVADDCLARNGIQLEVGRTKNVNKNPEGEWAIQELELELKKAHHLVDSPVLALYDPFGVDVP